MVTARWRGSLPTAVRRHRRGLAALLAGLAVLVLGLALVPPSPAVAQVVVTARDLPAGHRLALADLALAPIPTSVLLPGQSADPAPLVGQVLAAPMLRGEPMSPARVLGEWRPASLRAGAVAMPVRFADPDAIRWLTAGQRIDVLAARSMGEDPLGSPVDIAARVIAEDATVLVVPTAATESGLLDPRAPTAGQAAQVLLGVTPAEALAIAGAQPTSALSYRLEPAIEAVGSAGH